MHVHLVSCFATYLGQAVLDEDQQGQQHQLSMPA
jgi:hypothetical protein